MRYCWFPQPAYLEIPDWFTEKGKMDKEKEKLSGAGLRHDPRISANLVKDDKLEENIKKAAKEIIDDQVNLGIDVITDGEVERGTLVGFYCLDLAISFACCVQVLTTYI